MLFNALQHAVAADARTTGQVLLRGFWPIDRDLSLQTQALLLAHPNLPSDADCSALGPILPDFLADALDTHSPTAQLLGATSSSLLHQFAVEHPDAEGLGAVTAELGARLESGEVTEYVAEIAGLVAAWPAIDAATRLRVLELGLADPGADTTAATALITLAAVHHPGDLAALAGRTRTGDLRSWHALQTLAADPDPRAARTREYEHVLTRPESPSDAVWLSTVAYTGDAALTARTLAARPSTNVAQGIASCPALARTPVQRAARLVVLTGDVPTPGTALESEAQLLEAIVSRPPLEVPLEIPLSAPPHVVARAALTLSALNSPAGFAHVLVYRRAASLALHPHVDDPTRQVLKSVLRDRAAALSADIDNGTNRTHSGSYARPRRRNLLLALKVLDDLAALPAAHVARSMTLEDMDSLADYGGLAKATMSHLVTCALDSHRALAASPIALTAALALSSTFVGTIGELLDTAATICH